MLLLILLQVLILISLQELFLLETGAFQHFSKYFHGPPSTGLIKLIGEIVRKALQVCSWKSHDRFIVLVQKQGSTTVAMTEEQISSQF